MYILENISKSCWAGTEQIRSPRKRPVNEGGWRVSVQREKRKRRKKEKRNELKILLGGQIGHVKVVSKTGSGLCGSASWDCYEDAIASSIGCHGVAQDSGSKFFFFFNGRYRFFYRPLRGCAGFQVRILFFFCNGHYCFRYRLLRGCGGFWVKILFLKKMVPQSNSTGYQFSLTRIASGQYISSFSTGSEQQKRWINKDGKLIKVLDITEA